jgi:hypothetical protein
LRRPRSPAGHASGKGRQPCLDLLVGKLGQPVEIELGAGEAGDVLRLATREAKREEVLRLDGRHPLPRRKRGGMLERLAECLGQPIPYGECGMERDLLGRDRGDERLERIRGERRAEATQTLGEAGEDGLRGREGVERVEIEERAQIAPHGLEEVGVVGVDPKSTRPRLDPHLPPGEDAVEGTLVPEVGQIGAEGAVALGRELEIERLRKRDGERRR